MTLYERMEYAVSNSTKMRLQAADRNDGAPISKESQDQIFIPFYTTKRDGSGIGLSQSRQIMRAHNGLLDLTRSDEQGTVFTMTFR